MGIHDDQCEYWDELEFRHTDQGFDGGEWSAAAQDRIPMLNKPCGHCQTCKEVEKYDAENSPPYDPGHDEYVHGRAPQDVQERRLRSVIRSAINEAHPDMGDIGSYEASDLIDSLDTALKDVKNALNILEVSKELLNPAQRQFLKGLRGVEEQLHKTFIEADKLFLGEDDEVEQPEPAPASRPKRRMPSNFGKKGTAYSRLYKKQGGR